MHSCLRSFANGLSSAAVSISHYANRMDRNLAAITLVDLASYNSVLNRQGKCDVYRATVAKEAAA